MIAFSMCIGNASFELQLSSCNINHDRRSEVAVEYLPSIDKFINESDALLKLQNFNGTLRISRIASSDETNTMTKYPSNAFNGCSSNLNVKEDQAHNKKDHLANDFNNFDSNNRDFSSLGMVNICKETQKRPLALETGTTTIATRSKASLLALCDQESTDVGKLRALLFSQPTLARQHDSLGRLPLHIICKNESLVCGQKQKEFKSFVKHLYKIYPEAIMITDNNGYIPFSEVIDNWVNQSYEDACRIRDENKVLPRNVDLNPIAKWSFEMLSELMSEEKSDNIEFELVVDKIASIKSLVKTVLGISDTNLIPELLSSALFKKILLRKEAIGSWIVKMLKNSYDEASRVILYFEILSSPKFLSVSSESFQKHLITCLSKTNGLIPSLNNLSKEQKLKAAGTSIVQQLLTSCFMDPVLIATVFSDVSFHILLVLSYNTYFWFLMRCTGFSGPKYTGDDEEFLLFFPSMSLIWNCLYFLIRDDLTNVFVARSIKDIMRLYARPSNLIKFTALMLALVTPVITFYTQTNLGFVHSVTIGLLGFRLLILLKDINIKLSAFIVTVNKIVKSMIWFLVIFIIGCYTFAGMMMMAITATKPEYCEKVDIRDISIKADFCSLNPSRGALRAFAMMAGDVSLDDYYINPYTTYIWMFTTMFGVIVLLNVLIAVVTDAYQQSYAKRLALANRERIPYLTKYLRLKYMARSRFDSESKCRYFWKILCLGSVLVYIFLWHFTVIKTLIFLYTHREFDVAVNHRIWNGKLRLIGTGGLQIFCIAMADMSLIYIGLKTLGFSACDENKKNRFKTFVRRLVKSLVFMFLGICDQSEFNEIEKYLITMREVIEESESRMNSKLDELHDQMSILLLQR